MEFNEPQKGIIKLSQFELIILIGTNKKNSRIFFNKYGLMSIKVFFSFWINKKNVVLIDPNDINSNRNQLTRCTN